MSLSDLASLGSFVSGLAVFLSLVLLFFQLRQLNQQVRQAERNQQAAIRQGRASLAVSINTSGAEPSLSEALVKGSRGEEDISATTLRQIYQYWRATFFVWEDFFYQHANGLYTEDSFEELKANTRHWVANIGARAQWRIQRMGFGGEFAAWMDEVMTEIPIGQPTDTVVLWRKALAAERSGAPY
jgi:hypothetical protein